jgi:uncharacterized protein (TIGR03118 family)
VSIRAAALTRRGHDPARRDEPIEANAEPTAHNFKFEETVMKSRSTVIGNMVSIASLFVLAACGGGGGGTMSPSPTIGLTDAALVSNGVIAAAHTDASLQNAWGLASAPNGAIWIADNNSNASTVYDGTGATLAPVVSIAAGSNGPANPTGVVFNPSNDFVITTGTGSQPAHFLFAGEGGTINGWNPTVSGTSATVAYDDGVGGAVYKGLALLNDGTANHLYATDLHNAKIDVFDAGFHKVALAGTFADATIPPGFAPFGIQVIAGQLYVTYAKQDATAHDETLGAGLGYVDVFSASGMLVKRFASAGALDAPWGIAMAPAGFAPAAGQLLIGNFGDGVINTFDPVSGNHLGSLSLTNGNKIVVPGLWALAFGNGAANQPASTLFYTAGPNNQTGGVLGRVDVTTASAPACTGYGC